MLAIASVTTTQRNVTGLRRGLLETTLTISYARDGLKYNIESRWLETTGYATYTNHLINEWSVAEKGKLLLTASRLIVLGGPV